LICNQQVVDSDPIPAPDYSLTRYCWNNVVM